MDIHDMALACAGFVGCVVAAIHGVLTQRTMVRPILRLETSQLSRPLRALSAVLLQYSTFNWFVGGVALLVATFFLGREAKLVVGLLAAGSYLYGALGNLAALRKVHPGFVLYLIAVIAIAYGLSK